MESLINKLDKLAGVLTKIQQSVEQQKVILDKHTILLERLSKKVFPENRNLNIFPIRNYEELIEVKNNLENLDRDELVRHVSLIIAVIVMFTFEQILYIKTIIEKQKISDCIHLFFSKEYILKVNWDGSKNKTPIKETKLFKEFVYETIKGIDLGYMDFEKVMKEGFRVAKNKFYRKTYKTKNSKN